ncbi:MAG: ATP-dependent Clp protease ATP-binding subunit [Firmicutes bacterium]|nr:ATP-dependent Clp protease ATP-binding subunit [Bacillota bacterium]
MFELNNYNEYAREVVKDADKEALMMGSKYVGSEHLLLAILAKKDDPTCNLLGQYGLNYGRFKRALTEMVGIGSNNQIVGYAQGARNVLLHDVYLKKSMMDEDEVTIEVLAVSVVTDRFDVTEVILNKLNFDRAEFVKNMTQDEDEDSSDDKNVFEEFTTNLNERYKAGKIDPVIGREDEIERMIQILSRRTKNNPTLIGEPGVGKTAIVDGLAERIVEGNVPYYLKDKEIYSVDLTSLVAGTKYRGDFEARIKRLLEIAAKNSNVILFIDEIHNIVGAGGSEGSLDASNILKPYLQKGDIQIIGATTFDEYRKYIEKDSALERRLQTITVDEPSVAETIEILKGIRDKFEDYHKVKITDEALVKSVTLSDRYLSERFLPDKAIDVMDEAMSKSRTKSKPQNALDILKENLLKIQGEKENAIKAEDFMRAAKLRDEERVIEGKLANMKDDGSSYNVVDIDTIEQVVAKWSGVPVTQMNSTELQKLQNFGGNLRSIVIGQDDAINVIDKAIKRSKAGLKDPKRPIASMLFVGPTGVGKTYLAKRIAYELFGDENKLTTLDMSEYMEKHSVSKLIGSPPGYVGFEDGGQLTEIVRRRPYQVILFDEIEKAHPDIFNALLQILEEGRLTDSKGKEVDFKNTVIILTSNAGTSDLKKKNTFGFNDSNSSEQEAIKSKVDAALKSMFKPEFLNRIDEIVIFHSLDKPAAKKITMLEIEKIKDRIKHDYKIEVTEDFIDHIVEIGFSDTYGARPLKRALTTTLEDEISELIIDGKVLIGDSIVVDYNKEDKKVVVEKGELDGKKEPISVQ